LWVFYVAIGVLLTVGVAISLYIMHRCIAKAQRLAAIAPEANIKMQPVPPTKVYRYIESLFRIAIVIACFSKIIFTNK
jgi:hypothetical protein